MLKDAHHHAARIALQNIFGAIAMVYVKINHSHFFQAAPLQCMLSGNGDVVEQTKTHRFFAHGVMPGRANRTKGVGQLAVDHCVGGGNGGTCGAQGSVPAVGIHRCVGVYIEMARASGHLLGF